MWVFSTEALMSGCSQIRISFFPRSHFSHSVIVPYPVASGQLVLQGGVWWWVKQPDLWPSVPCSLERPKPWVTVTKMSSDSADQPRMCISVSSYTHALNTVYHLNINTVFDLGWMVSGESLQVWILFSCFSCLKTMCLCWAIYSYATVKVYSSTPGLVPSAEKPGPLTSSFN